MSSTPEYPTAATTETLAKLKLPRPNGRGIRNDASSELKSAEPACRTGRVEKGSASHDLTIGEFRVGGLTIHPWEITHNEQTVVLYPYLVTDLPDHPQKEMIEQWIAGVLNGLTDEELTNRFISLHVPQRRSERLVVDTSHIAKANMLFFLCSTRTPDAQDIAAIIEISYEKPGDSAELAIEVAKSFQHHGIASHACEKILQTLQEAGWHSVKMDISNENTYMLQVAKKLRISAQETLTQTSLGVTTHTFTLNPHNSTQ